MINIFNELYTYLVETLANYDDKIKTSSVYTNTPSSYPFVSLEEIDNSVYEQGSDNVETENFANVEYEVNIYTQSQMKKSQADGISQVVDELFNRKGFTRITRNILQDTNETTYRIIIRYHGVVSKEKVIYRR
jgi:hypothetical protein